MESDHCLSHGKHPSTLSNTFKSMGTSSFSLSHFTFHISHFTSQSLSLSPPIISQTPPSLHQIPPPLMAPLTPAPPARSYHPHALISVVFIFFLSMLASKSGGISVEGSKMVIGSRPPECTNKCMNCRPCMATVVVPSHQQKKGFKVEYRGEDDDTYYFLTWKCKCGNKLYQP